MIHFQFGKLEFENCFAFGFMNAGICIDEDIALQLFEACLDYFGHKPFIYISIRKKAYSINPLVYNILSDLKNFKAMAVVVESPVGISNTGIEKKFIQKPFKAFKELDEAKEWAMDYLK